MNIVDLFCGAGGLSLGFRTEDGFTFIAHLDNNNRCIETIGANNAIMGGDTILANLQDYGSYLSNKPDSLLEKTKNVGSVDLILGGPPCQAYSIAGRVRDPDGMNFDERNFLFEAYVKVVGTLRPKFFLFENVTGMLSATPNGTIISTAIYNSFNEINYEVFHDFKECIFNVADFGVPQNRKRVILFGVDRKIFKSRSAEIVRSFYSNLIGLKEPRKTVWDAISDLPRILPFSNLGSRISHKSEAFFTDHEPRYHNERDIKIFRLLAKDALCENPKYKDIRALKELYFRETGRQSEVHKYFILPKHGVSNTIPAHLHKDGLRHIHPDPEQARSITVREAARLQSFPDSYNFVGSQSDKYKMIGNAVPPYFAIKLANALLGLHI